MNKVELIGRLTKDLTLAETTKGVKYAKFNLAIQRKYKNEEGNPDADFISCVAWEKLAETLVKYTHKGDRISIVGHLQSRQYESEGKTKYALEVMVDEMYIIDYAEKQSDKIDF